ncbi:AMP-binding protein [Spiractinospora alimapuensis]|uniref:AMP-binding protein n=1 Tax=Spiractinospora alimapuensis TaxID=2820884 RepID=UPI001F1ADA43|nr:AMP-binding protein [Spiractinospora alimapuensis]QVQ52349.1 AMP-binding protein [Spiractinospora alimapuensis]
MNAVLEALSRRDEHTPVLHDAREALTAGQSVRLTYRFAHALSRYGYGPGDVVALVGPVSSRLYLLSHAVELVGAAQMEVPLAVAPEDQLGLIEECGTALVVVDPETVDDALVARLADHPTARLCTLAPSDRGEDLVAVSAELNAGPMSPRGRPGTPIRISLTGGTTGRAKPVVRNFRADRPDVRATFLGRLLGSSPRRPRTLVAGRPTGLLRTFADATVARDGRLVCLADFESERVLETVQRHGITHLLIPAHELRGLVDHPACARTDLSSLSCVTTGGGPVSPALLRAAVDRLGPIVYCSYGQTEAGNIAWLSPEDYSAGDPAVLRSCGRPVPGVEVRVRDDAGGELTPNERGRVWVRTPIMMHGYWNRPQATARVFEDGWLDTGDVGFRTEDGYLTILGRSHDAMTIDGRTVFSSEVDTILEEHPQIQASATFDVAGATGTTLHTAVVPRPGVALDPPAVRSSLVNRLAPHQVPSTVRAVPHIPYTYAHELCWNTLRAWHAASSD